MKIKLYVAGVITGFGIGLMVYSVVFTRPTPQVITDTANLGSYFMQYKLPDGNSLTVFCKNNRPYYCDPTDQMEYNNKSIDIYQGKKQ
jgi:hypothetical protein